MSLIVYERLRLLGAIAGALALGLVVFLGFTGISSNRTAIEKGCILLNNAVVRSQAEMARPGSSTSILIAAIMDNASAERRAQFSAALEREQKRPNPLIVPCDDVADQPKKIKAIPLKPVSTVTTTTVPKR